MAAKRLKPSAGCRTLRFSGCGFCFPLGSTSIHRYPSSRFLALRRLLVPAFVVAGLQADSFSLLCARRLPRPGRGALELCVLCVKFFSSFLLFELSTVNCQLWASSAFDPFLSPLATSCLSPDVPTLRRANVPTILTLLVYPSFEGPLAFSALQMPVPCTRSMSAPTPFNFSTIPSYPRSM